MHVPEWLSEEVVIVFHELQIKEHGGSPGIRDLGLLQSALTAPKNRYFYGEMPSIFELAASYGFSLSQNHPFYDGNKRIAFVSMVVFLDINGFIFDVPEEQAASFMLRLASKQETFDTLVSWLEANSSKADS